MSTRYKEMRNIVAGVLGTSSNGVPAGFQPLNGGLGLMKTTEGMPEEAGSGGGNGGGGSGGASGAVCRLLSVATNPSAKSAVIAAVAKHGCAPGNRPSLEAEISGLPGLPAKPNVIANCACAGAFGAVGTGMPPGPPPTGPTMIPPDIAGNWFRDLAYLIRGRQIMPGDVTAAQGAQIEAIGRDIRSRYDARQFPAVRWADVTTLIALIQPPVRGPISVNQMMGVGQDVTWTGSPFSPTDHANKFLGEYMALIGGDDDVRNASDRPKVYAIRDEIVARITANTLPFVTQDQLVQIWNLMTGGPTGLISSSVI